MEPINETEVEGSGSPPTNTPNGINADLGDDPNRVDPVMPDIGDEEAPPPLPAMAQSPMVAPESPKAGANQSNYHDIMIEQKMQAKLELEEERYASNQSRSARTPGASQAGSDNVLRQSKSDNFEDEMEESRHRNNNANGNNSSQATRQQPNQQQQQQQQPPEQQQQQEPTAEMKEYQETGKWGSVSSSDRKIVMGLVLCVIIIAVAVVVGVVVGGSDDDSGDTANDNDTNIIITDPPVATSAPTLAPTSAPTASPTDPGPFKTALLKDIIFAINRDNIAFPIVDGLSFNVDDYVGLWPGSIEAVNATASDPDSNYPQDIVMSWLFTLDEQQLGHYYYDEPNNPYGPTNLARLIDRFALACLFFHLGGPGWIDQTNFLMPDVDHCTWYGITCDFLTRRVSAVAWTSNSLTGTGDLPVEFTLLTALTSVSLRRNQIAQIIPNGLIFGNLPDLVILDLQSNQFFGDIPNTFLRESSLQTLLLQDNLFTGVFPGEYCPEIGTTISPLESFVFDCAKNSDVVGKGVICPTNCCDVFNCV